MEWPLAIYFHCVINLAFGVMSAAAARERERERQKKCTLRSMVRFKATNLQLIMSNFICKYPPEKKLHTGIFKFILLNFFFFWKMFGIAKVI